MPCVCEQEAEGSSTIRKLVRHHIGRSWHGKDYLLIILASGSRVPGAWGHSGKPGISFSPVLLKRVQFSPAVGDIRGGQCWKRPSSELIKIQRSEGKRKCHFHVSSVVAPSLYMRHLSLASLLGELAGREKSVLNSQHESSPTTCKNQINPRLHGANQREGKGANVLVCRTPKDC